jgi:acyl carrier protein
MTDDRAPAANAIRQRVLDAVITLMRHRSEVGLPDLSDTTFLVDVPNLDSLRVMETVALIEQQFGVEVDTSRLETLVTVGDISDAVSEAIGRAPAG